uniref:substrate-binding periplasmic protein n=1 Tax=Candidatus Electrothrix sp. TaxID=2170559 RepID=UPI004057C40A
MIIVIDHAKKLIQREKYSGKKICLLTLFVIFAFSGYGLAGELPCEVNTCNEGKQATSDDTAPEITLAPDMQRIIDKGKLVVAMHCEDGSPFWTLDESCKLVGLDVDLATDIAANLGVEVEFNRDASTYDGVVDQVASRAADIGVSCLSQTRKRAIKANFTDPYLKLHYGFVINRVKTTRLSTGKKFSEWINRPEILIGTITGSSYIEFMQRDYPKATVKGYPDWAACYAAVLKGEVHVVVFDDSMVRTWINEHPEDVLYLQSKILHDKEDPISIVVNWQDTHLLNWLNLYLSTLKRDGTLDDWIRKWVED